MEVPESPVQEDVSAAPNVPGLIQSTWRSKTMVYQRFMTVNTKET